MYIHLSSGPVRRALSSLLESVIRLQSRFIYSLVSVMWKGIYHILSYIRIFSTLIDLLILNMIGPRHPPSTTVAKADIKPYS